ncbi:hypothetical protein [Roseovarius amoyensis]|uniref:hypothetical protein n=1 Tax=Roseovarius amoyensis TaxID=2211448 RepID=UPI000DBE8635|nr:hypothetical protein [Roseovarius amoyensis]
MDPAVTGALISAGSNLLGGLFGGSSSSDMAKQYVYNMFATKNTALKQPRWLREGAEAAGFNPLTLLMSGAGQQPLGVSPGGGGSLSTAEFLGKAVGDVAETWFNREQIADQAELDRIKVEMAREELAYWKNRNNGKGPKPDIDFGYGLAGGTRTTTRQEAPAPTLSPNVVRPRARPFGVIERFDGSQWFYRTDRMSAQEAQDMYGEVAEQVTGARNYKEDAEYNRQIALAREGVSDEDWTVKGALRPVFGGPRDPYLSEKPRKTRKERADEYRSGIPEWMRN